MEGRTVSTRRWSDAHETIGRDAGARGGKPQGRRIRGAVGGDSCVRLTSGRTDGNAKRHGGGPSTMGRPATARPPAVPSSPVPPWRTSDGGRYAPVDHGWSRKYVRGGVLSQTRCYLNTR